MFLGEEIPLTLRLSARARRMKLRVEANRSITLILPQGLSPSEGLSFIRQEQDWLCRNLRATQKPVFLEPGSVIPVYGEPHKIIHAPEKRGVVSRKDGEIHVSGNAAHVPRRLKDWAYRDIRKTVTEKVDGHTQKIQVTRGRISIRDQKSRWGSCSSAGNLNFSWRLFFMPDFVIDYITAHEVAHLVHLDHSKDFWKVTHLLCSEMEMAKQWLKQQGASVHKYSVTR